MNFDPVGTDSKGNYHMKYTRPFTIVERIQLLQRSILVNSFAYYGLNSNILSDFNYDDNAKQLAELKKKYPDEFKRSRYYDYFYDYCTDEDDAHYTSGFDLLERVKKQDRQLYRYISMDANTALRLKFERDPSLAN